MTDLSLNKRTSMTDIAIFFSAIETIDKEFFNINFNWMGINKMKRFEAWYFDWKRFTANQIDPDTKEILRNALVHMLYQ